MNFFKSLKTLPGMMLAVVLLGGPATSLCYAEPPADSSSTNSVVVKPAAPGTEPAPVKKTLTGAELYSIHCNRCHAERYPTERTGAQWKTIMLHMQVRANIPGQQARLILQYLQENSGR
jgi:hypothetical protein